MKKLTYIAMLRGINVGGHKKIKMADLKLLFEELGFSDVATYIQSGNVVFSHKDTDSVKLELSIGRKIEEHYGFQVPVMIRTAAEFENSVNNNPYLTQADKDPDKICFTFLKEVPTEENLNKLLSKDFSPEEFFVKGRIIYLYLANGFARAKFTHNFLENKLKISATSRNLRTVMKLVEMALALKL